MIQNALDAIATTHNSKNEKNNELGDQQIFIEINQVALSLEIFVSFLLILIVHIGYCVIIEACI